MASIAGIFLWGDYFLPLRQSLFPDFLGLPKNVALQDENMALRTELERLLSVKEAVSHFTAHVLIADVYSKYPFNNKSELIIAVGSKDGVKSKMAVLSDGLLIGRIVNVGERSSSVRTIFDKSFELSVKIGEKRTNGLFKGGPVPLVSLISKDAGVKSGEGVISANVDLPFALPLGEISDIRDESGEIWQTAMLRVPYILENIKMVSIIDNF